MKKVLITLIALLAIAGTASAALINADLNQALVVDNRLDHNNVGLGWHVVDNSGNPSWTGTGTYTRDIAVVQGNNFGFGQIADVSGYTSSDNKIEIDYSWIDAEGDDALTVQVYGFTHVGGQPTGFLSGNQFHLDADDAPATTARYTVTERVAAGTTIGAEGTSLTASFDIGDLTGFTYVAVRVGGSIGTGDTMTVSRFEVVPEPATVGMLGLGALVALLIRRVRG